jgi:hypothetical protein
MSKYKIYLSTKTNIYTSKEIILFAIIIFLLGSWCGFGTALLAEFVNKTSILSLWKLI